MLLVLYWFIAGFAYHSLPSKTTKVWLIDFIAGGVALPALVIAKLVNRL